MIIVGVLFCVPLFFGDENFPKLVSPFLCYSFCFLSFLAPFLCIFQNVLFLLDCYGISIGFPWWFFGIFIRFHKDVYGIPVGILLDFHEISMEFLWHFHGIPTGFLW